MSNTIRDLNQGTIVDVLRERFRTRAEDKYAQRWPNLTKEVVRPCILRYRKSEITTILRASIRALRLKPL